jgi:3-oxo-5-alpha-steroid 4-dehydrogenase 1
MRGGNKMPFSIMLMGSTFCLVNGYVQGRYIAHFAQYADDQWLSLHFLLGASMFLAGFAINFHSDHILLNLRKPGEERTYKVCIVGTTHELIATTMMESPWHRS